MDFQLWRRVGGYNRDGSLKINMNKQTILNIQINLLHPITIFIIILNYRYHMAFGCLLCVTRHNMDTNTSSCSEMNTMKYRKTPNKQFLSPKIITKFLFLFLTAQNLLINNEFNIIYESCPESNLHFGRVLK